MGVERLRAQGGRPRPAAGENRGASRRLRSCRFEQNLLMKQKIGGRR